MTPSQGLQSAREYLDRIQKNTDIVARLVAPIAEIDFPTLNFYSGGCWIWCSTREQLIAALSVASGKWEKTPSSNGFEYRQTVDDVSVVVCSSGDALPATCRVVEEDIFVPATEATTRRVTRVVCNEHNPIIVAEETPFTPGDDIPF